MTAETRERLLTAVGAAALAFAAGMIGLLIASLVAGCGAVPGQVLGVSTFDPWDGSDRAIYLPEEGSSGAVLVVWKSGAVNLGVVVEGNDCGPNRAQVGPLVAIPCAYLGEAIAPPAVGDTLGGVVLFATVADTFSVTAGRFFVTCSAPDTLVGFAWLTRTGHAACHADTLARFFRLVRQRVPSVLVRSRIGSGLAIATRAGSEREHPSRLAAGPVHPGRDDARRLALARVSTTRAHTGRRVKCLPVPPSEGGIHVRT